MINSNFSLNAKLPQMQSVIFHGIPIIIEYPKGSVREGRDENGNPWRREQKADYGYIDDGSTAVGDNEPLDIYIGSDGKSDKVYVIEQLKNDKNHSFDEYKLVAGVPDLETAQSLYLSHYPKEWGKDRLGDCYETDLGHLKAKVEEHQEEPEVKKAAGEENMETTERTKYEMAGTKLTGFYHDGPATCMDCIHRTPHSKNAQGEEVDSCSHPAIMKDPEIPPEKKLPDGTIEVDADDWCRFAQKPKKGVGEEKATESPRKPGKKTAIGSIYLRTLAAMR